MLRRSLLAGVGAAALLRAAGVARAAAPARPRILAWLRLNGRRTRDQWRRELGELREAGVDEILAQVFPSTHARYASALLPVQRPVLADLLPAARAHGLRVHAWMHALRCNVPTVLAAHADWYAVSRAGLSSHAHPPYTAHYRWLCPTRPEVREFLARIAAELAAYPEVDGVHLDFIRHPDVFLPPRLARKRGLAGLVEPPPEYDFCYCAVCRAAFQAAHGEDPQALPDVATNAAWARFRRDRLSELVAEIKRWIGCRTLSAAVFPTPALARAMVRQDWDAWPLDAVMPMIYHRGYEQPLAWIETAAREGVEALGGRAPLYAGLLLSSFPARDLPAAIRHASAAGAAGVCLFNLAPRHHRLLRA